MMKGIFCKFQIEGVHRSSFSTEEYEREDHRHMFHFIVTVNGHGTSEELRLLNPIRIRRFCLSQLEPFTETMEGPGAESVPLDSRSIVYFGDRQAIDIAELLAQALTTAFEERGVRVEVSEDGENGGVISLGEEFTAESF